MMAVNYIRHIEGVGLLDVSEVKFVSECAHDSGEFCFIAGGVKSVHYGDHNRGLVIEAVSDYHKLRGGLWDEEKR